MTPARAATSPPSCFPAEFAFRHAWRPYQKRVLFELPPFDPKWAEVLLNGILFGDRVSFARYGPMLQDLSSELNRLRAISQSGST
jgi:hypothetical protein